MANENTFNKSIIDSTLAYDPSDFAQMIIDEEAMYVELQKKIANQGILTEEIIGRAKKTQLDQYAKARKLIEEDATLDAQQKAKALEALKINTEKKVAKVAETLAKNLYAQSTLEDKRKLARAGKEFALNRLDAAMKKREAAAEISDGRTRNKEMRKAQKEIVEARKEVLDSARKESQLTVEGYKKSGILFSQQRKEKRKQAADTLKQELQIIRNQKERIKQEKLFAKEKLKEIEEEKKKNPELKSSAKDLLKERFGIDLEALEDEDKQLNKDRKETLKEKGKEENEENLEKALSNLANKLAGQIDSAMAFSAQYSAAIATRLDGTGKTFDSLSDTFKKQLAVSPYVKQTKVIESLDQAVREGIAYNVEQRAFLASITDKIVTTFDAFDKNLNRLIRLQQADTTAARMGLEAELNNFLNVNFKDTSYLTDAFDTVSENLLDANSQMTRDMSVAFEYNVQKWLGSLSSLGLGTDTISTIAQGIGYLGSGNVQDLVGNEQLNSLLAISASRSGESYSQMLIDGINDSQANNLLRSMVLYLKEIAESDNQVVKSAYGDVFNLSQSDFRAIANLTANEIEKISSSKITYSTAIGKTQSMMSTMSDRMQMSEMMENVYDNVLYSTAESLANNPVTAFMWKTLGTLQEAGGENSQGTLLPFINAMGFGLDLNMSIEQILRTGMMGLSFLSNIPNMFTSLASSGGSDLDAWDIAEWNVRGGDVAPNQGVHRGTSGVASAVTTASSSDTKQSAIADTEGDQEAAKQQSKEMSDDAFTIEKFWEAVKVDDRAVRVAPIEEVSKVYDEINERRLKEIYSAINNIRKNNMNVYIIGMESTLKTEMKPKSDVNVNISQGSLTALADKINESNPFGIGVGETGQEETSQNESVATILSDIRSNTSVTSDWFTRQGAALTTFVGGM